MKKVIITVGGYGYRPEPNGAVKLIMKSDGPIEVTDEEAERIIGLGIAEAYEEESGIEEMDDDDIRSCGINELRTMAKDLGLSAGGSKAELIERIIAIKADIPEDDEEDGETPPSLSVADPE